MKADGRTLAGTNMTAEQRRERALKGSIAGAVSTIERHLNRLTADQRARLIQALNR